MLDLYFGESGLKDPMASPAFYLSILAKFPPTLLLTGTRDFGMSTIIYTHTQLIKSGAEAYLYVWEGAGHGAFVLNEEPESLEALAVISRFFDRQLGKVSRKCGRSNRTTSAS
jgi:acetyl esterase/lipase